MIRKRIFSMNYERLFSQMVGVSVAVHVFAVIAFVFLPQLFPDDAQADTAPIEVELTNTLPKGPGFGPNAPDRNQEAVRRSDPRKARDIQRERDTQHDPDAVKITRKRQVNTNRLGWRDKQKMKSAVDKIREKRAAQDTYGGGGTGQVSASGILSTYLAAVRSQITSKWSLPGGLPSEYLEKKVVVRIYIDSSGRVIRKFIAKSSNFEPLDRSCLSAVLKASPLRPPPRLLADQLRNEGMLVRFHPRSKRAY